MAKHRTTSGSRRADAPVVVIGAGIGGLIAAIELAVAGHRVRICESADHVGGKARVARVDGCAINAGPTVLTLPAIFEDTLARACTCLAGELALDTAEVLARHAWPDRSRLDLFADPERSAAAIEDFAGAAAADGFRRFQRDAARASQLMDAPFLRAPKPSMARLVLAHGPAGWLDLARINPFATLWRALGRYFDQPVTSQIQLTA